MSTKLRDVPRTAHKRIRQTVFNGGENFDGIALQLTMHHDGQLRYIAVSRDDAFALAEELLLFAQGKEVE